MHAASYSPASRAFAVVPAAGRSARMGSPKLLLPWRADGTPVIAAVLDAWRSAAVERIVVTVHPDDAALAEVCRRCGAEVVVPAAPPPEMKSSIAAALEHLRRTAAPRDDDCWLVAPADLPLLAPATIRRVVAGYDSRRPTVVRPRHAGRFGHPVLLPWSMAADVSQLPPDAGLNALLGRPDRTEVACDADCIAADIDTPAEYAALRDRYLRSRPRD